MHEAERFLAARTKSVPDSAGSSKPMANIGVDSVRPKLGQISILQQTRRPGILLGLMLLGGLFSILAAILRQLTIGLPDILAAVVVAPPVEEILKVAVPIMVLEHRMGWLGRGRDLLWFAMGSALVFAVVENLLYSFVYLTNPSSELLWWRWTACTAMHVVASGLSGVGLLRAYNRGCRDNQPPRFVWEWPWLAGAIAVHMAYNTFAVFFAESF